MSVETTSTSRIFPAVTSRCFACGRDHPCRLHLSFVKSGQDEVRSNWRPETIWEGFQGVIHGGIVSTVLDEAMSKAVAAGGTPAYTCDLRVRLKRHVTPGERLEVRGWVIQRKKRKVLTEATIRDAAGFELAHAWATFLQTPGWCAIGDKP